MSLDEIRGFRNAQPFRPFDLLLQGGRVVHVSDSKRIGIAPWGRLVIFENGLPHMLVANDVKQVRTQTAAS